MLETFLVVIHIFVALFLILVVLVQGGHSGGVGIHQDCLEQEVRHHF